MTGPNFGFLPFASPSKMWLKGTARLEGQAERACPHGVHQIQQVAALKFGEAGDLPGT